jgi:DNA modification methylase
MNPILIDDEGGIIAGHGRWAAAKLLGLQKVPTLRFEHLSDADKRAYILADNRIAEKAGWDREILAIELQAFVDMDFDIEVTGFEMAEVELILDEALEIGQPPLLPEDAVPEASPGQPVVQSGDTWILGAHRLYCGDARDNHAYRALLENTKAEFVFTDPPYNVPIAGNVSGLGRVRHRDFAMASGEMSQSEYIAFLQEAIRLLCAHTLDGSIHDICMDWRHAFEMLVAGRAVYTELKNICVWNKTNAGMGSFYRSKHELIFIWKSGRSSHVNNFELGQHGRSRSNVWDYAGVNSFKRGRMDELAMHPTVKPVGLVADAIRDCSRRGGLILDPFAGSGTIVIAAERTGRKARVIEIDRHQLLHRVEGEFLQLRRQRDHRGSGKQQSVSIGHRRRDLASAKRTTRARPIFDHEALAEPGGQTLSCEASHHVRVATRAKRHNDGNRFDGPIRRLQGFSRRNHNCNRQSCGKLSKRTHHVPPPAHGDRGQALRNSSRLATQVVTSLSLRPAAVMPGGVRADRAGRSVQSISLRLPHDLSADIRQPGPHTAVRRRGPRRRSATAFLPARRNS